MARWTRGTDVRRRAGRHSLALGMPSRLANGQPNPAYQAAYYAQHRERIRVTQREWRQRTGRLHGPVNLHYRRMVIALLQERDGALCWICQEPLSEKVSIDHVIQRCQGGDDSAQNLRLAHLACNRHKERRPWPRHG